MLVKIVENDNHVPIYTNIETEKNLLMALSVHHDEKEIIYEFHLGQILSRCLAIPRKLKLCI